MIIDSPCPRLLLDHRDRASDARGPQTLHAADDRAPGQHVPRRDGAKADEGAVSADDPGWTGLTEDSVGKYGQLVFTDGAGLRHPVHAGMQEMVAPLS
jgi:hypothetical protein